MPSKGCLRNAQGIKKKIILRIFFPPGKKTHNKITLVMLWNKQPRDAAPRSEAVLFFCRDEFPFEFQSIVNRLFLLTFSNSSLAFSRYFEHANPVNLTLRYSLIFLGFPGKFQIPRCIKCFISIIHHTIPKCKNLFYRVCEGFAIFRIFPPCKLNFILRHFYLKPGRSAFATDIIRLSFFIPFS